MKKLLPLLLAALMTLTACGGKEISIDPEKLAADLLAGAGFTDELTEVSAEVAELLYGIEDSRDGKVFVSSGATAEELGIFEFADEEAAKAGLTAVERRLETQREDFARYVPAEVPKLEDAVAERYGRWVVCCVSGDGDKAREIIASYT